MTPSEERKDRRSAESDFIWLLKLGTQVGFKGIPEAAILDRYREDRLAELKQQEIRRASKSAELDQVVPELTEDRTITAETEVEEWFRTIGQQLLIKLINECFESDHDGGYYVLRMEYHSRLLEYEELKLARETAEAARDNAQTATWLAVFAIIVSIFMPLISAAI